MSELKGRLEAPGKRAENTDLVERSAAAYASAVPVTPGRRTEIRQALGVLDAVFLGEPGVLEARQRLTVRMRSAGKA